MLDKGQLCEQAGFRRGFCKIDHIHTIAKLTKVSREFKLPLCLTFIDVKKAFDFVETEAFIEALLTQGVPTQNTRVLRKLYSGFTTKISPCYSSIVVNMKGDVQQWDTISHNLFNATLQNIMSDLECEDQGAKIDGRQQHHPRFADDIVLIVLITPSITRRSECWPTSILYMGTSPCFLF